MVLYTHKGYVTAEEFKLRKVQTCPNFEPEGDIVFILLDSKQTYSVLQGDILSLSFKTVLYTTILENLIQSKSLSVPLLTRWEETQKINEELSPNTHILNP